MNTSPTHHHGKSAPPLQAARPGAFLALNLGLLVAGIATALLLLRFSFIRDYDYDELSHAHMAWLLSIGDKPYRDFAANHFPFFWILLSPVMHIIPESPLGLALLRCLALALNAVFVTALGTLICLELRLKQRIWAAACLALVVFFPITLNFLVEFRPDALANALLFSSLLWLRLRGGRSITGCFVGGLGIGLAVLVNTKYLLFPFVLGGMIVVVNHRKLWEIRYRALPACAGFAAALLGGVTLLALLHIPIDAAWRSVVTYNATVEKSHTFGFGLAGMIWKTPWGLAYILAGLATCVIIFVRNRLKPEPFLIAMFIFLAINLCTTTRPWKQYLASWFLLAACFPMRSLPVLVARLRPQLQAAVALCIIALAITGYARAYGAVKRENRPAQDQSMAYILRTVPPNRRIISSYYTHPVFRRDTFYKTVYDMELNGQDGLEQFMPGLLPGTNAEQYEPEGYQEELETQPPALIVLIGGYTGAQSAAMATYLDHRSGAYTHLAIPIEVFQLNTLPPPKPDAN